MNSPTCDRYYPTVYVPESYDSSTFCEADTVKNGVVLANLKRSYKKLYKTVVNEEIEETKELASGVSPDFKIGESDDYGL